MGDVLTVIRLMLRDAVRHELLEVNPLERPLPANRTKRARAGESLDVLRVPQDDQEARSFPARARRGR